jgi:hypothetical protein
VREHGKIANSPTALKALTERVAGRGRGATDVNDATWISDLVACGLIQASFVPEEEIQHLRSLLRAQVGDRLDAWLLVVRNHRHIGSHGFAGTQNRNLTKARAGIHRALAFWQASETVRGGRCSGRDPSDR